MLATGRSDPLPLSAPTRNYMRMYSKSNEGKYVIIFPGYESYYVCNTIWKVGLLYIMVNYGWISWKEEMFMLHSKPINWKKGVYQIVHFLNHKK